MKSNIILRQGEVRDIEALSDLLLAMAKESEGTILVRDVLVKGIAAIIEDPDKGFYLIAETEGTIAGCLLITFEWSDWRNGLFWWIQSVYVLPYFRRKGIYALLYRMVKELAGVAENVIGFRLYVNSANETAREVYRKMGMNQLEYWIMEEMTPDIDPVLEQRFIIEPVREEDRSWISSLLEKEWGSSLIVTRGRLHEAVEMLGFVARIADRCAGLLVYRIENKECEIISLNSLFPRIGIGSALVQKTISLARAESCRRIWLITTNDNTVALRFYQRLGFQIAAVHKNALEKSRKIKPSIPLKGMNGIPLLDEIELEMYL